MPLRDTVDAVLADLKARAPRLERTGTDVDGLIEVAEVAHEDEPLPWLLGAAIGLAIMAGFPERDMIRLVRRSYALLRRAQGEDG